MPTLLARLRRVVRPLLPWSARMLLACAALGAANASNAAGATQAAKAAASPAGPTLAQCHGIKDLAFVAHLDDDLLFMNPDIAANIEAGGCVRVVYLTASERGEGEGYMLGRERGVRAAYSYMAGQADDWKEDTAVVDGYHLARFTLTGNPRVQLWHMRLKDPWLGTGWGSLTPLSQAESEPGHAAETLGPYPESYTRDDLVAVIARIIRDYRPTTVRRLDDTIAVPYTKLCWRCAGHGHPDHIASARLVRDAMARVPGNYAETGYVDYPSQEHEANLADAEAASKTETFRRYAWNDYRYCAGPQGCQEPAGPAAAWVRRAYYVSPHDAAPGLFADPRSGLTVFAAGEANDAVNLWNNRSRRWSTLGGRTAGPLVSFAYPDATAGIFARDTLGGLWANKQNADGTWRGWQTMAGPRFSRVPATSSQGATAAVAMANDGLYYWSEPAGLDGAWAPWRPLPGLAGATGSAAVAVDARDRLVVFASRENGRLYATVRQGADGWTPWRAIPAPAAGGGLAAIRNGRGLIELYLREQRTGQLLRVVQDEPAAAARPPADARSAPAAHARPAPAADPQPMLRWQAAARLGVEYVGRPAVGLDENGEVAAAVLERPGGALWLIEGRRATQLAPHVASLPTLRFLRDTLYVVARSAGPMQAYQVLARNRGVWAAAVPTGDLPAGGGGPFGPAVARAPRDM